MWKVKRNEYRTHCGSGHRRRRRRHCRISRQRVRRQACAGPAGRAAADRRYSRRQIGHRPWPLGQAGRSAMADLAGSDFISRASKADAIKEITGSIARSPFIAGEPIREQKLVKADGSGFMAAILPAGYRAISTEISPETGAGGFILPNDRVDVLLTKREKNPNGRGAD